LQIIVPIGLTLIVIAALVASAVYLGYSNTDPFASSSCPPASASPSANAVSVEELRVFVASSLINAVEDANPQFEQDNNCKVVVNIGGSNGLYQQIIAGAPCDVFMSADFKWTNQLSASSWLYNDVYQNFTSNTLEVLTPKDNPANLTTLLDLAKPQVKLVIADLTVPVGSYLNKTLTKIDATWGNTSSPLYKGLEWENFRAKVLANVVSYETKVQDVVGKVSVGLGTVDAGVAFISDATYGAMTGAQLQYIEIPAEVNTQGTYGIAVMADTAHAELAAKYVDFWLSTEGQATLKTYGFGT
jgi:molybdate transport system substrate-binding protein